METSPDVLIIGSGPAGLMSAIWLASQGVSVEILEKNEVRPERGRADGFEPRTLEILDSFGLLDSWIRKANQTVEFSLWVSDRLDRIERVLQQCNSSKGTSRFYECTMDQAVLERAMEDLLAQYGVQVKYGVECLQLERGSMDRVTLTAKHSGVLRRHNASYVIGADGASSWTRKQVGVEMQGARTTHEWGVVDIYPLTNFPDIRNRCVIHRKRSGTLMVIPREAGLVRLYIQLGEEASPRDVLDGPSGIIAVAKEIMQPFKLDYKSCHWSSRYRVQQAIASSFTAWEQRVFLVGDAVHTHTPKAGMGLNISIQDSYNLGWKLAAVIRGEASPSLLATYEDERRPVAKLLVDFDRRFYRCFADPISEMSVEEYRDGIIKATKEEHKDLSGVAVQYANQGSVRHRDGGLADGLTVGRRISDGIIVSQADGRAWKIHDLLPSNGKWRILVFPGDIQDPCALRNYVNLGKDLRGHASLLSICDILTIHHSPRHEINLLDLPDVFHPWDDTYGWDYLKVFADAESYHEPLSGRLYEEFQIQPGGCLILCRPDQHIAMLTQIVGAVEVMADYLSQWYTMAATSQQQRSRVDLHGSPRRKSLLRRAVAV